MIVTKEKTRYKCNNNSVGTIPLVFFSVFSDDANKIIEVFVKKMARNSRKPFLCP